jgi:hypothetical protein
MGSWFTVYSSQFPVPASDFVVGLFFTNGTDATYGTYEVAAGYGER